MWADHGIMHHRGTERRMHIHNSDIDEIKYWHTVLNESPIDVFGRLVSMGVKSRVWAIDCSDATRQFEYGQEAQRASPRKPRVPSL